MQPIISIITPLFNRRKLVEETWQSINRQTEQNWEWIVVDDGSTDGSQEFILALGENDPRIKLLHRTDGAKGPSRCRNMGAEKAMGKYLIFLDSDDLLAPFCIEKRINALNTYPNLDLGVFNIENFKTHIGDLGVIFNKHPQRNDSYLKMFLRFDVPWQTSCPLWKTEIFRRLGGFAEDMFIAEDPELHTRVLFSSTIKLKVFDNLPADIYYRYANLDTGKNDVYTVNSINGRILYIEKINTLINCLPATENKMKYKKNLGRGYKHIVLNYIFSTRNQFINEFRYISDYCLRNSIITRSDYFFSKFVLSLWSSDSKILFFFRIKGLFTRLYKITA